MARHIYVDHNGQIQARYVRLLGIAGIELALTWITPRRGWRCRFGHDFSVLSEWHDEGAPLYECSRCGEVDA